MRFPLPPSHAAYRCDGERRRHQAAHLASGSVTGARSQRATVPLLTMNFWLATRRPIFAHLYFSRLIPNLRESNWMSFARHGLHVPSAPGTSPGRDERPVPASTPRPKKEDPMSKAKKSKSAKGKKVVHRDAVDAMPESDVPEIQGQEMEVRRSPRIRNPRRPNTADVLQRPPRRERPHAGR
jgi:hypothetical protein